MRSAYETALNLYPDLANWYVASKEVEGSEAVRKSRERVSRADDLYRTRVLHFLSTTLRPLRFFDINVKQTSKLLATFARAIEQNGRALFLGEDGLVDELSTDDVKLVCTLAWRADG